MVDLSTIPLVALSARTKQAISTLLNPLRIIPSEDGLPRDWRGLAHCFNISGEVMPFLASHSDPTIHILTLVEKNPQEFNLKALRDIFEKIERWDVFDDTAAFIENDAEVYVEQLNKSRICAKVIESNVDAQILTVDDLHRIRQGLENQYYDAFLLYANEDISFANEIIHNLENQSNFKLCVKDRDLVGGITFEHEAVMTLISERCNRLIVVVSPDFLKSPENKFFLNFAQALGIEKRQRKIVPCLYKKCQLPIQLSYMFVLDYNRNGLYDFWGKLRASIQVATVVQDNTQTKLLMENQNTLSHDKRCSEDYNCDKTNRIVEAEKSNVVEDDIEKAKKVENLSFTENVKNPTKTTEKQENISWWSKLNRKTESSKQNYQSITETISIDSLPSPESLEGLVDNVKATDKKPKKKFLNKYLKKVHAKKIMLQS